MLYYNLWNESTDDKYNNEKRSQQSKRHSSAIIEQHISTHKQHETVCNVTLSHTEKR